MKLKKTIIGMALVSLFLLSLSAPFTLAKSGDMGVDEGQEDILITSDYITMKIVDKQPHFIWWNGNRSSADEMYKVQFKSVQEFFGDDTVLDSIFELNGLSYNLVSSDWLIDISEDENHITVTMTLNDLANEADIQFIVNIYAEDEPIEGTDQVVEALTEVKFDIVVNNWIFSEDAKGLTFKVEVLEAQQRHRVRIRNGTAQEHGNATRNMVFESEENGNNKVAYFEWTTFADVYNGSEKIDTIDVGTAFFEPPGDPQGPIDPNTGMIHFWLTYPNYGDSLTLVHDPSIGINPDSFVSPLYFLPIIGGLVTTAIVVAVIRKRKQ
ncbi:MAG: hypothetical protein U9O98_08145 [Asgard group archaeon]|nr:hypothetical protein [Asgard group archaeon]